MSARRRTVRGGGGGSSIGWTRRAKAGCCAGILLIACGPETRSGDVGPRRDASMEPMTASSGGSGPDSQHESGGGGASAGRGASAGGVATSASGGVAGRNRSDAGKPAGGGTPSAGGASGMGGAITDGGTKADGHAAGGPCFAPRTPALDCTACANSQCAHLACSDFSDPLDQARCSAALDCIHRTGCEVELAKCYCGSLDYEMCQMARFTPDGLCVAELTAAFPANFTHGDIQGHFTDGLFPGGAAVARRTCELTTCLACDPYCRVAGAEGGIGGLGGM